jgi:hypothetical protein
LIELNLICIRIIMCVRRFYNIKFLLSTSARKPTEISQIPTQELKICRIRQIDICRSTILFFEGDEE